LHSKPDRLSPEYATGRNKPSDLYLSKLGKIIGYMAYVGYRHGSSWVWMQVLNFPLMQNPYLWARVGR